MFYLGLVIGVCVGFLLGIFMATNCCKHEWELVHKISVMNNNVSTTIPIRYEHVYICKKCKKCKVIKY